MVMSFITATAVFLLFAPGRPLAAQADPDRTVAGGGNFPAGWHVRTETNRQTGQPAPREKVRFTGMRDGRATTGGPAAICYRDRDTICGKYRVVPQLSPTKKPD